VPHFAHAPDVAANGRWPWVAVTLFIAAGAILSLADGGRRSEILAIPSRVREAVQSYVSSGQTSVTDSPIVSATSGNETNASPLSSLPGPAADGEIVLAEEGPYDVSSIVSTTPQLTIRGAHGVNATIQVDQEPLHLTANSVTLSNVRIVCKNPNPPRELLALLLVQSQQLRIHDCEFQEMPEQSESGRPQPPVVAWSPLIRSQPAELPVESRIEIQNSVWRSSSAALWFAEAPTAVSVSNVLKLGRGACFAVSHRAAARPISFELSRLTMRDSGPLLRMSGLFAERTDAPEIEIAANDCVFKLASIDLGLVEFQTGHPRANLKRAIRMSGEGSLIPEGSLMMVTLDPDHSDSRIPVADADEQFEGLMPSELGFAGPGDGSSKNSRLIRMTAPRSSQESSRPGIDSSMLPVFRSR
jgi:hypothetical protein